MAPEAEAAAEGVKGIAGAQRPLAAGSFPVQGVAFDVGDELVTRGFFSCVLTAEVDLVQVAGAVVEVVERAQCVFFRQGRQEGTGTVAQGVVFVTQGVGLTTGFVRGALFDEAAECVVGKANAVQGGEFGFGWFVIGQGARQPTVVGGFRGAAL